MFEDDDDSVEIDENVGDEDGGVDDEGVDVREDSTYDSADAEYDDADDCIHVLEDSAADEVTLERDVPTEGDTNLKDKLSM